MPVDLTMFGQPCRAETLDFQRTSLGHPILLRFSRVVMPEPAFGDLHRQYALGGAATGFSLVINGLEWTASRVADIGRARCADNAAEGLVDHLVLVARQHAPPVLVSIPEPPPPVILKPPDQHRGFGL